MITLVYLGIVTYKQENIWTPSTNLQSLYCTPQANLVQSAVQILQLAVIVSLKMKLPLTQFWSEIIKVWCETTPKILSLTVKQ